MDENNQQKENQHGGMGMGMSFMMHQLPQEILAKLGASIIVVETGQSFKKLMKDIEVARADAAGQDGR
jgi:hypothetical protein